MEKSPYANVQPPQEFVEAYELVKAKLRAHLEAPDRILHEYEKDDSLPARYAKSIAHYRSGNRQESLKLLNTMTRQKPKNAYFWEFKGEVLLDLGRVPEATVALKRALRYSDNAVIKTSIAHILTLGDDRDSLMEAVKVLRVVLKDEKQNAFAWRLQAKAYGKLKNMPKMALALAEEALVLGRREDAVRQAERALYYIEKSPNPKRLSHLKIAAQDIKRLGS